MRDQSRQNLMAGFLLFLILLGVYSLSYSGVFTADDEQLFAAAAVNAAEIGELSAEQLYGNLRLEGNIGGVEPFHSLAASWVLRSGVFAGAGQIQVLFWLNGLYTALTGLVVFALVLQFGGRRKQAIILCLVFSFGTLAWPYAKTFFREPLAMLLLALTMYLLVLGMGKKNRTAFRVASVLGALVCFVATLLTKVLLLAVLPGLVVLMWGWGRGSSGDRRNILDRGGDCRNGFRLIAMTGGRESAETGQRRKKDMLAWGIALAVLAALLFTGWAVLGWRLPSRLSWTFFYQRYRNLMILPHDGFWAALAGIFFSPGKGVFFYMPMLPVFFVGGFALRGRKPVLFWCPLLAVMGLAVAQALVYDAGWWNMTWGTRFMLPMMPLMLLMGLPVVQWMDGEGNTALWTGFWVLFGLGVVIQLGGVLVADPVYLGELYEQTLQPVTELILWQVRYVPWIGHWQMIFQSGDVDLAVWRIFQQGHVWALVVWAGLVILVMGCAVTLLWLERKGADSKVLITAGALGFAMLAMIAVCVCVFEHDPAWYVDRKDLAAAVEMVEKNIEDEDGVVIAPYLYPVWHYAMNEAQFGRSWYSWPVPGDAGAAEQAMEDYVPLAEGSERIWLIEEGAVYPAGGQFREVFELMETRRFGEDVWVSLYRVP